MGYTTSLIRKLYEQLILTSMKDKPNLIGKFASLF